ncbi:MAG: hypothetical protein JKY37_14555 [Nannocystaceae bacterium]|nr:hypothetical protein [Nannocystaceae bacterium]
MAATLGLAVAAGALTLLTADTAEAAVRGAHGGVAIEGAKDRRGFYIGTGAGFGGTFFYYDDFIPAMRMDLALGGGITKRLTFGADLHVTPYLAPGVGVGFGATSRRVSTCGVVFICVLHWVPRACREDVPTPPKTEP